MSIAEGDNEIETAAARVDTPAGTTVENEASFEATEDRLLTGAYCSTNQSNCVVEISFSNSMLIDAADAVDQTASGVIAMTGLAGGSVWTDHSSSPPHWHAGEELNVHVDNQSASSALVATLVGYVPVGEFRRSRLRNSQIAMVDYPTFAGIVVSDCPGADFGDAADIWNREKDAIRGLTVREIRMRLECP